MTRRSVLAGAGAVGAVRAGAQDGAAELSIAGLAGSGVSALALALAPGFEEYARERLGRAVRLRLVERAADAALPPDVQLAVVDGHAIAGLAAPKLIAAVNPILQARPGLDVEWYAPVIRAALQVYPEGSNNRWGFPLAGDTLALFVRRDWLESADEQAAFAAGPGAEAGARLPRSWEDFEGLDWPGFISVLAFFTRPEAGRYGLVSPMAGGREGFAGLAWAFMSSRGGALWEGRTGQVEGVLNTAAHADGLAACRALLAFQPPGAGTFGVKDAAAAFARGGAFAALQWISAGPATVAGAAERVSVVLPPAFRVEDRLVRDYPMGGLAWVLNAAGDAAQRALAADFIGWWQSAEMAAAFAGRGGAGCDNATLTDPGFDGLQPWFRAYRTMLRYGTDLWRDPRYAELLEVQQEAFAAYVAGRTTDPARVLDAIACRQQAILFDQGTAERPPGAGCKAITP